jgi:hypothetical protein
MNRPSLSRPGKAVKLSAPRSRTLTAFAFWFSVPQTVHIHSLTARVKLSKTRPPESSFRGSQINLIPRFVLVFFSLTGDKKTYQSGKHHVSCYCIPPPPPRRRCPSGLELPLPRSHALSPAHQKVSYSALTPPFFPRSSIPLLCQHRTSAVGRSATALGTARWPGGRITTFEEWTPPLHTHGGSATDAETLIRCLPRRDRVRIPPCFVFLQRRDVLTGGFSTLLVVLQRTLQYHR